jgi:hypothetical protein
VPRLKLPEKLNDSVNIPVKPAFKRRLLEAAKRQPGKPAHTRYARTLLEKALDAELVVK